MRMRPDDPYPTTGIRSARALPVSRMTSTDPMLVINPVADAVFARACDEAMASHPARPDDLQVALRRRFPAVIVRPRALSDERLAVWYVYRDGHWVSSL